MNEDERLREALLELGLLRAKETERLRETTTLLSSLEALTTSANIEEGLSELRDLVRDALECDFVVLFDVQGDTLVDEEKPSGAYSVVWDGRRDNGEPAASGVYIYRFVTEEFKQTKKMLLLK